MEEQLNPGSIESEEGPTLEQKEVAICTLFIAELQRANSKFPALLSSAEAQGVLLRNYTDAEDSLLRLRTVDRVDMPMVCDTGNIKHDLVQLGAMCIKAIYSLCDVTADCSAVSEILRLQVAAQEATE